MATRLDQIAWAFAPEAEHDWGLLGDVTSGPDHVDRLQPVERRTWALHSDMMTSAEKVLLEAEWDNANGGAGSTLLTPPEGGSQVAVEFLDDELRFEQLNHDVWRIRILVREIL